MGLAGLLLPKRPTSFRTRTRWLQTCGTRKASRWSVFSGLPCYEGAMH